MRGRFTRHVDGKSANLCENPCLNVKYASCKLFLPNDLCFRASDRVAAAGVSTKRGIESVVYPRWRPENLFAESSHPGVCNGISNMPAQRVWSFDGARDARRFRRQAYEQ